MKKKRRTKCLLDRIYLANRQTIHAYKVALKKSLLFGLLSFPRFFDGDNRGRKKKKYAKLKKVQSATFGAGLELGIAAESKRRAL